MKTRKRTFVIILSILILLLCVGALGLVTKGFRNWNPKEWFKNSEEPTINEEHFNEVIMDFNNASDLSLNFHNVRSAFNSHSTDSELVEAVMIKKYPTIYLINNVFLNIDGLNLGYIDSENDQEFSGRAYLRLKEDFSFNRVEIFGYNYYKEEDNLYYSTSSALSVNYSTPWYFSTNELNHSLKPVTDKVVIPFSIPQNTLILSSIGQVIITQIHLYTVLL
jgi:hypothetical protein